MEELQKEVARIALRMYEDGLVAGTSGNISIYDRKSEKMAITPTGLDYKTMDHRDIVVLDLQGHIFTGGKPSSELLLHSRIYQECPHVNAVVHTHSPYATAFAVLRLPIECILIEMAHFLSGGVPVTDFAPAGSEDLAVIVANTIYTSPSCLLSNHGVVTVGSDLKEAYLRATYVEDGAKIYHLAKSIGHPVIL